MKGLNYEYPQVKKLLLKIKELLDKFLGQDYELYVFGSFARGDARPNSDLDIALKTEKEIDRKTVVKIKSELHNLRTLRKVDFVYLNAASENLKKVVQKEGVQV